MKSLIILLGAFSVNAFAEATPTYRCECFKNGAVEAYEVYVIINTGGNEEWIYLEDRPTQYDDYGTCMEAANKSEVCQSFDRNLSI